MLTEEEIKRYAHMRRLKLIDHIWKDYLQDLLLFLLYRKIPNMIFGGGTCVWKVLKGDRFSEDIDAYALSIPEDITDYLKKELALLGIKCNILKKKKTINMLFLKFGLSFSAHQREIIISLEILSDKPKKTERMTLYSPYPDIPPFEIIMLSAEEMLVNKVSAIYKRNRARDVHDIYILLKSGTRINMNMIRKKIQNFNLKTFEKKILEKQAEWKSLEPLIVTKLPSLKEEDEFILSRFCQESPQ
jgi:predicted nucleotidyltransferase component of viral defense system